MKIANITKIYNIVVCGIASPEEKQAELQMKNLIFKSFPPKRGRAHWLVPCSPASSSLAELRETFSLGDSQA